MGAVVARGSRWRLIATASSSRGRGASSEGSLTSTVSSGQRAASCEDTSGRLVGGPRRHRSRRTSGRRCMGRRLTDHAEAYGSLGRSTRSVLIRRRNRLLQLSPYVAHVRAFRTLRTAICHGLIGTSCTSAAKIIERATVVRPPLPFSRISVQRSNQCSRRSRNIDQT